MSDYQSLESSIVETLRGDVTETDYQSLESSIVRVMEGRTKPAMKKEAGNDKAKDDSIPSKKDGGDAKDGEAVTGQETQRDASMPTPTRSKTDNDITKNTEDTPDGKADKIMLYPRIGESVEHRIGDTVYYNIGTSDHLKRGTIELATPTHFHVRRDKYIYRVPKTAVMSKSQHEAYEQKQPYVLQTDEKNYFHRDAKVMGLTHYGQGRYGRNGLITHRIPTAVEKKRWRGLINLSTPIKTSGHETAMREGLAIQPNLNPDMGQPGSSLPTTESTGTMHKVGDIVKPKIGPHAGYPHSVIHVFPDGKVNIKPVGIHPTRVKYHQGAAGAYPKDLA